MRGKKLLAAFLLGVGLCFVPALGHGEVQEWRYELKPSVIDFELLEAKVEYIMQNPTNFLIVYFYYDRSGALERAWERATESGLGMGHGKLPKGVKTKGKILVRVFDNRGVFSHKTQIALLGQFKKELEAIVRHMWRTAPDMNADIVATFWEQESIPLDIPLGYFYQGEYHLWEKIVI